MGQVNVTIYEFLVLYLHGVMFKNEDSAKYHFVNVVDHSAQKVPVLTTGTDTLNEIPSKISES